MKVKHIFECPNTTRNEKIFDDLIRKNIVGKKALDIGCSPDTSSHRLSSLGPVMYTGLTYLIGVLKQRYHGTN